MKNISTIIVLILGLLGHAQDTKYIWKGVIKSQYNKNVEFANVQVKANSHYFLFMANDTGYVEINYPKFNITDSVFISCIGYKTKKISCAELNQTNFIILKEEAYKVEEVIVNPKKSKIKKLGNLNRFTISSSQIAFESQAGLYIPNRGINGKIINVNIYMHDFSETVWKYRPFRLRLFEGDYPFEKEITKDPIIVSLKSKKGHWLEIDLTNFDIDFPKNGILVAVEVLPFPYYKQNGYINSMFFNGRVNSLSIGATHSTKTKDELKSYALPFGKEKWELITDKHWYYLIQIDVKYEKIK